MTEPVLKLVRAAARDEAAAPPAPVVRLSGWGRYPVVPARLLVGEDLSRITAAATLSRGMGRAYGDAALPARAGDAVACTTLADRLLAFDPETGVLRAEAGLSLARLNAWSLPRGWFTPVSPGTQFVSLGGMVAADVHGKNHHVRGCLGQHVQRLRLRVADGRIVECSAEAEEDLFRATLGGMGLTGHILEVDLRLERVPSPWIWEERERVQDLESLIGNLRDSGRKWPFTVAWADALHRGPNLGRGVMIRGRWARPEETAGQFRYARPTAAVPFDMPDWLVSTPLVRAFNWMNYLATPGRVRARLVHPVPFFYPLDAVLSWNRLYGKRGFTQYQAVLPYEGSLRGQRRFFERVVATGQVFLCVIKDCGPQGNGMLSFPKPGISYALDLPVGPETQRIVDDLNDIVASEGGRVYLAKDAFTRAEHFRAMEPRLDEWLRVRDRWDPARRLRSALSLRLFGD